MEEQERLDHQWNLWYMTGVLDHNKSADELNIARFHLLNKGLGPDHSYFELF